MSRVLAVTFTMTVRGAILAAIMVPVLVVMVASYIPWILVPIALAIASTLALSFGDIVRVLPLLKRTSVVRRVEGSAIESTPTMVEVSLRIPSFDGTVIVEERYSRSLEDVKPALVRVRDGAATYKRVLRLAPGLTLSNNVVVRYQSILGFFEAKAVIEDQLAIPVYPAFTIPPMPSVGGLFPGFSETYTRLYKGFGVELYSLREYQAGDDPRRIVWRASARLGRLVVREDLAEAEAELHILLDLSKPVWEGRPGRSLGDNLARVAASIAYSIARVGGLLGYTIYTGVGYKTVYRARGIDVFRKLYSELASIDPLTTYPPSRTLVRVVEELTAYYERGHLVLILSEPSCKLVADSPIHGTSNVKVVVVGGEGCVKTLRGRGFEAYSVNDPLKIPMLVLKPSILMHYLK